MTGIVRFSLVLALVLAALAGCEGDTTNMTLPETDGNAVISGDCSGLTVPEVKCTSTTKDVNGMLSLKPYTAAAEMYQHTKKAVAECADYHKSLWVYEAAMEMLNAGRDADAVKTWYWDAMRQMAAVEV